MLRVSVIRGTVAICSLFASDPIGGDYVSLTIA